LHAVSIGAPGRPTGLDISLPWPQGVADIAKLIDGKTVDQQVMKQVRAVQLVIGEHDTNAAGRGLFKWLANHNQRGDEGIHDDQDTGLRPVTLGRKQAIELIQRELTAYGIDSQLAVVADVGHGTPAMLPAIIQFLEPLIQSPEH
jgi:hypothetical protein